MGVSNDSLLVKNEKALESIFASSSSPSLIVTHCEEGPVINQNKEYLKPLGRPFKITVSPINSDLNTCFTFSCFAVSLAKKHNSQLHVLHITSEKELISLNQVLMK